MRKIHRLMAIGALVLAAIAQAPRAWAAMATLEQIQGEVSVSKSASPDLWAVVTQNTPLDSGDTVKTSAAGSAAIVYSDQGTFAVQPGTTVTLKDQTATSDLLLKVGMLKGKVNHDKAVKPFQVMTPAAVAAIRGTEVDFGFNDQGEFTADLHNGKIEVINEEADMQLTLAGQKKVLVHYDKSKGIIRIQNDCGSDGVVSFTVLGTEYAENPCEKKEINLSTAEGDPNAPKTPGGDDPENPRDDIPKSSSPTTE